MSLETKDTAPYAVSPAGMIRASMSLRDALEAAPERHHLADA